MALGRYLLFEYLDPSGFCQTNLNPPKEPKIMAEYLKIETFGSIGSIILAILEVHQAEAQLLAVVARMFGTPGASGASGRGRRLQAEGSSAQLKQGMNDWAAVKELKASYHSPETISFICVYIIYNKLKYVYMYIYVYIPVIAIKKRFPNSSPNGLPSR